MLEKIQIVKQRFDEVNDLIIQPDIISDQKRYVQLNKEYKDLKKMVDIGLIYESLISNIEEAKEIKNSQIAEELALPPVKIHCSVLAEDAIKAAVNDYYQKNNLQKETA